MEVRTFATVVDICRWRAQCWPDRRAYVVLGPGDAEETLSYAELDQRARALAAELTDRALGARPVLLLYSPGADFLVALCGCLYAGAIAITSCSRELLASSAGRERIEGVLRDSGATVVLTTRAIIDEADARDQRVGALAHVDWVPSDVARSAADSWAGPLLTTNAPAILQYTSGSTGRAKGVIASHRNLVHQAADLTAAFRMDEGSVVVSWLPTYHDMGLISGVVQPLVAGVPSVLMAPSAFLGRPLSWLRAIARFRGTHSGAPNFAYELCARRHPTGVDGLDLSSWRCAVNGAEPIRGGTLLRFFEAFRHAGLRWEVLTPAYGLCEATLMVTAKTYGEPPRLRTFDRARLERKEVFECSADARGGTTLVGCGSATGDTRVLIADPETLSPCGEGQVGEILVSGATVSPSYWGRHEETQATFGAMPGGPERGPFLRTGDLGFQLEGELFVSGRLKDLIIVAGRNLLPQEIEATASAAHPALRAGNGVAFSVDLEGEERVVVVQEVINTGNVDISAVIESIREAVVRDHGIQLHAVLLVKPRSIPKTTSGKVRRQDCKQMFMAHQKAAADHPRAGVDTSTS